MALPACFRAVLSAYRVDLPGQAWVEAGNCWMTPGSMDDTYVQPIVDGVKTGRTRLERLRENVAYILKTMIRFA